MNNETILGLLGATAGTGGISFMLRWMFKNTVSNTNRITTLETTAVTSKQLDETIDKTIVPIREDITQFGTTLAKTMDDLRDMKADQLIEAKAKAQAQELYAQMIKDQS